MTFFNNKRERKKGRKKEQHNELHHVKATGEPCEERKEVGVCEWVLTDLDLCLVSPRPVCLLIVVARWLAVGDRELHIQIIKKVYVLDMLVQFSSVTQSCPTLCDPIDYSTPGFPVPHQLPEFAQTHVYQVSDAIQPSHPLLSLSPPALSLSQHQDLFQWASSSHQVAKVLELQLQYQSFQWIFRTDFH